MDAAAALTGVPADDCKRNSCSRARGEAAAREHNCHVEKRILSTHGDCWLVGESKGEAKASRSQKSKTRIAVISSEPVAAAASVALSRIPRPNSSPRFTPKELTWAERRALGKVADPVWTSATTLQLL